MHLYELGRKVVRVFKPSVYPFIQARNYTRANRKKGDIGLLVIHTMESPEKPSTAEDVAKWFAGKTAPQASTHYNVDADSIVQSVRDKDVAWCAPGANHNGLHFEHAGTANQTSVNWSDPYSKMMLRRSANLVAEKAKEYGIPVRHLTPDQIGRGQKGICGHWDVTRAYPSLGSHTDPGQNFPWILFMGLVRAELARIEKYKL